MTSYHKNNFRILLNRRRAGLSLIEVLIGLTVTLIVLGAMAGAFRFASEEMAKGRASLELTNRLRTIENLFREDLRRLTVELKPYHRLPLSPQGYAEIIDGPVVDFRDVTNVGTTRGRNDSVANLLVGDYDDVFAGTIRSDGAPFRGRRGALVEESHLAEVVWFATFSDIDGDDVVEPDEGDRIRLFRRQLLIKPALGVLMTFPATQMHLVNQFIQNNDISCNVTTVGGNLIIRANSLQDLARRGNRYAHTQGTYAQRSPLDFGLLRNDESYLDNGMTPTIDFNGDGAVNVADLFPHRRASDQSDLMLSDIAAFDIRVFDPDAISLAALNAAATAILDLALPTDLASLIALRTRTSGARFDDAFYDSTGGSFVNEPNVQRVNRVGAYVDLGKVIPRDSSFLTVPGGVSNPGGVFQQLATNSRVVRGGTGVLRPALDYGNEPPIFDTGTSDYDSTTILGAIPLGSNGIDDNGNGLIDEEGGEKLVAPYDAPIRGLEVKIRMYEPNASQARQVTVRQSMVPQ